LNHAFTLSWGLLVLIQDKTPYKHRVFVVGDSFDSLKVPHLESKVFIANQMRKLRRRHGLTQEQAAALIGCDYKYYQVIEAGAKDLRLSMLERLAQPFGLRPGQLFLERLPASRIAERK
jgi:DNA-binding XRE family transcriptional regulator